MTQNTLTPESNYVIENEDWEGVMRLIKKANEIILEEGKRSATHYVEYYHLCDRLENTKVALGYANIEDVKLWLKKFFDYYLTEYMPLWIGETLANQSEAPVVINDVPKDI